MAASDPALNDSGLGGPVHGRFDDLAAGTALAFPRADRVLVARETADVVPVLAEVERATAAGAWAFGYVAYEAAPGLHPGASVPARPPGESLPLAVFGLADRAHAVPPVAPPPGRTRDYTAGPWRRDWTPAGYRDAVAAVRASIAAGDAYQVNLTVRMHAPVTGDLEQLYADLAYGQRGSWAAFLDVGSHVVASASPELFVDWTGDRLLTRPMKGTARRGATTIEDDEARRALLASDKERAENLMIVDLLRNDLGRIAEVGSVEVPVLFRAERYETVWQLTSDVTARPRPDVGLVDVFRALFPSGSVTGAPKHRTMQLIRELEAEPRGVYCGAVGVVAPPGQAFRARFNVAIRTVTVERAGGTAVYGTGGGITWASDADAEHAELLAKAEILGRPYEEFALLETMARLPGGTLRNLEGHLDRLAGSAAWAGFPLDLDDVRRRLARVAEDTAPARVRLVLRRDGGLEIEVAPPPAAVDGPVRLAVDPEPVDADDVWLRHKTTRRDVYTERAARWPAADDVVLTSSRGEVTETTIANLAVRLDGRWWTPPVSSGCLPGVERGRLVAAGRLHQRPLTPDDLTGAEELAVVNSLRGWRAAVLL
ncbi:para-aminobenzoate synthetase / 4-amino-4-deoxychorismate lyase [Blastococcus aurantiacus]|uniref:Para-aminobenzoate synthetase / 4-amino-4-deoxychorismate lyase n=1 Tax=Blastococcus aurantiacus TaxID=1550231 RepID=A0A1G7HFP1_9ACTN|nr:aminodeoxychorismate synthase component I [Blastococcus aurantiacus]SDE99317.1 para-aminobenzoate synthetase / 4-amino-4-deoxychorismate lyase [Blastococcus aurantiacus]